VIFFFTFFSAMFRKMLKEMSKKPRKSDPESPRKSPGEAKEDAEKSDDTVTYPSPKKKRRKIIQEMSEDEEEGQASQHSSNLDGDMADTEHSSDRTGEVPSDLEGEEEESPLIQAYNGKKRRLGDTPVSMRRKSRFSKTNPRLPSTAPRDDSDVSTLWDFDKFMLSTYIYSLLHC
jgi:hypothetical protein